MPKTMDSNRFNWHLWDIKNKLTVFPSKQYVSPWEWIQEGLSQWMESAKKNFPKTCRNRLSWMEWVELGETCRNSPEDRFLPNKCYVSPWEWIQEGLTVLCWQTFLLLVPGNFFCHWFPATFFLFNALSDKVAGNFLYRFPETFFVTGFLWSGI